MGASALHIEGPLSVDRIRQADSFISNTFYGGSLDIPKTQSRLTFHLEQVASNPCPLTILKSASHHNWRRSWADIRKDGADFCVLRLLKTGSAKIMQCSRAAEMKPGDLLLSRSNLPVYVELDGDEADHPVEMLLALIPSAVLAEHTDIDRILNTVLPRNSVHHGTITDLLALLERRAASMEVETGNHIASALLREIGNLAASLLPEMATSGNITELRFAEIRATIRKHFSNPNLSVEMIGQKCGISARYVTHLMTKNRTCFHDEVQTERLNAARRILRDAKKRNVPIKQIAFYTGFKSASHFSFLYKKEFGCQPKQDRHGGAGDAARSRSGNRGSGHN